MTELLPIQEPQPLLLTVDDYRILHESGAFEARPKVELIEGVILTVSPQKNAHAFAKSELARRLGNRIKELDLPFRAITEGTMALLPNSAPGPDITITAADPGDDYMKPDTTALVIEVANTSEAFDLGTKADLYARGGISEYWVLLLRKGQLVRHWAPAAQGYAKKDKVALGEPFESITIPALSVMSDGLL